VASARRSLGFSVNPQTSRETMPTVSASHVLRTECIAHGRLPCVASYLSFLQGYRLRRSDFGPPKCTICIVVLHGSALCITSSHPPYSDTSRFSILTELRILSIRSSPTVR